MSCIGVVDYLATRLASTTRRCHVTSASWWLGLLKHLKPDVTDAFVRSLLAADGATRVRSINFDGERCDQDRRGPSLFQRLADPNSHRRSDQGHRRELRPRAHVVQHPQPHGRSVQGHRRELPFLTKLNLASYAALPCMNMMMNRIKIIAAALLRRRKSRVIKSREPTRRSGGLRFVCRRIPPFGRIPSWMAERPSLGAQNRR